MTRRPIKILSLLLLSIYQAWLPVYAESQTPPTAPTQIDTLCQDIGNKLTTITFEGCLNLQLNQSHSHSHQQRPLTFKEILPTASYPKGKILFISGIHGDEYAAISLGYLWLQTILQMQAPIDYHWVFLPFSNPDGILASPATRTNGQGVDINRNFPSPDWPTQAINTWKTHYKSDARRFPGQHSNSEPETQWLVNLIERYQPDAIISLHAPFGLLDYDGPMHAQPDQIGHLKLRTLGTYPGSLGRYAGEYLNIPVLTVELNSTNRLPNPEEIENMFADLETWVSEKIKQRELDF